MINSCGEEGWVTPCVKHPASCLPVQASAREAVKSESSLSSLSVLISHPVVVEGIASVVGDFPSRFLSHFLITEAAGAAGESRTSPTQLLLLPDPIRPTKTPARAPTFTKIHDVSSYLTRPPKYQPPPPRLSRLLSFFREHIATTISPSTSPSSTLLNIFSFS